MKIPAYYAANAERLTRFAAVHVADLRAAIARNEAAGRETVAAHYRRSLQAWRDVLGNPAAFVQS